MTFKELFEQWHANYARTVALHTAEDTRRYIEKYLSAQLFDSKINEITAKQILDIADNVALHSTYYAKRIVADIARIFDYAQAIGIAHHNPAARIGKFVAPHKTQGHKFADHKSLSKLFKDIDRKNKEKNAATLAFWLIVYTAVRRQEAISALKSEFDFKAQIWTIPAERMKIKTVEPHIVPLSRQVIDLLEHFFATNNSIYAFPSPHKSKDSPINAWAPYYLLCSTKYSELQTLHGFRKVFSTHAHDSGLWTVDAIELSLAHKIGGVRGIYNHAKLLNERKKLMSWYALEIDRLRGIK